MKKEPAYHYQMEFTSCVYSVAMIGMVLRYDSKIPPSRVEISVHKLSNFILTVTSLLNMVYDLATYLQPTPKMDRANKGDKFASLWTANHTAGKVDSVIPLIIGIFKLYVWSGFEIIKIKAASLLASTWFIDRCITGFFCSEWLAVLCYSKRAALTLTLLAANSIFSYMFVNCTQPYHTTDKRESARKNSLPYCALSHHIGIKTGPPSVVITLSRLMMVRTSCNVVKGQSLMTSELLWRYLQASYLCLYP